MRYLPVGITTNMIAVWQSIHMCMDMKLHATLVLLHIRTLGNIHLERIIQYIIE